MFGTLDLPATTANSTGYALTAAHLLVGAAYWWVKEHQLRDRASYPAMIQVFRWLRPVLAVALAGGAVVVIMALVAQPDARSLPGLAFWLLALAEYVNYFHRQLMPHTPADVRRLVRTGRLHRSHLNIDLRGAAPDRLRR